MSPPSISVPCHLFISYGVNLSLVNAWVFNVVYPNEKLPELEPINKTLLDEMRPIAPSIHQ